MRTSTGLHVYLSNGYPVSHVYENPALLEGRGWYTNANYALTNVKDITAGPVSGRWAPWVEMKPGSGGIPVTSHRVALDANIHAGDLGTELLDGAGPYEGRVMIDTTTLSNGWHKLFLRASQFEPISGSTNSSVFVALFEVLNETPPNCSITHVDPAVADAYVRGGSHADNNFGADDALIIKSASDDYYTRHSFLRFDLSVFQASSVAGATFKGYVYSHQTPGVSVPLSLYAVNNDDWNESTITWNNQPAAGLLLGTVHVSDVGPVEFDIASHLANELSGDRSLSLVLVDDSGANKMLKLRSRSDEYDPPSIEIIPSASECTTSPPSGPDTTPPVITLTGDPNVYVVLGSSYTDAGATATDDVDGDITASIVPEDFVDVATVGAYTVTYNVSDAAGNAATEVARTVNVTNILLTLVFETRIATGADDAEERESGSVYIDSSDIELVHDGSRGNQTIALRFNDVQVPQGAVITDAHISFVADESDSEPTSLTIQAEAADSSQALLDQSHDLSTRPATNTSVTWKPIAWSTGDHANTPDISSVVQEVTSRTAWSSGNALTILVNGTGKRVAESYEGRSNDAALLYVEYVLQEPVISLLSETIVIVHVGTPYNDAGVTAYDNVDGDMTANVVTVNPVDTNARGTYTINYNVTDTSGNAATEVTRTVIVVEPSQGITVFETRIATGADDAEEKESGSGSVSTSSSDLELVADGSRGNQTIALRFNNVQLPQGAAIVNAYISFVTDESDSGATALTIQAEAVDSSPALLTQSHNLSSRATTNASVTWEPIAWSTGDHADTPNIASVVQEVISRNAWVSGNALTILVNGVGKRVAESYNGSSHDAALLHVEYY